MYICDLQPHPSFMFDLKSLIETAFNKYRKAFLKYYSFILQKGNESSLSEDVICWAQVESNKKIQDLRGYLYDFFDSQNIIISVSPYDIKGKNNSVSAKWGYLIWVEGTEIREKDFLNREQAELIAFEKAFQFVDTKLIIEEYKHTHLDESADSCNLRINYEQLSKVLSEKRKLEINK